MKNLKLLSICNKQTVKADSFCVDFEGNLYFASCSVISSLQYRSKKVSFLSEIPSDSKDAKEHHVIGLEYLAETDNVFIASTSGEIYLYDIYKKEVSAVGCVETNLEGFAWSPDQEFLVLLTGANSLILMTKDFDPITEKNLCSDEFGESAPIAVGWGSKETQFHGSEGKGAAHTKKIEPKPALPYDDRRPRISWRGDGEYFVTSTVDHTKGYRLLHIWSREAILQYTSEIKEGLEEPVCWRPMGNVIACSQQEANKHKIIFFEKNGLQHGEFVLPFKPNSFKVSSLKWNSDSSVLLVVAEELTEFPSNSLVMLWTSSNYHWYLKQSFQLKNETPFKALVTYWSLCHPYDLYCYNQTTGEICTARWTWSIFHQLNYCDQRGSDDAIVASIDNDNVLITTFGKLIIPPPLCAYLYNMSSPVQSVFFSSEIPAFGIYLQNFQLAIFMEGCSSSYSESSTDAKLKFVAAGGNGFKSQIQPYSFCGFYGIDLESSHISPVGLCHWTWVKANKVICVGYSHEADKNTICSILSLQLPATLTGNEKLIASVLSDLESSVIGMCANNDGSVVAVQLDNGKIMRLCFDTNLDKSQPQNAAIISPWLCASGKDLVVPHPCTCMSIYTLSGKDYFLGLTERYNLFCNEILILSNCTSYYIHEEFLVTTTADHTLKFFSKECDIPEILMANSSMPANVQSQKIEKGARIIIVPYSSTKVILQMPRGNLETLNPRPLVISSVCRNLDSLQFGKAFELSKVHRIDLNLLYDHNPKHFLENIEKVIEQINSPSDLNLLLASLKNEDVRVTMYPLAFKKAQIEASDSLGNKINEICNAFRAVLVSKNDNRYYQTVMATYAKKSEPELDQALLKLKALKDSSNLKSTQDLVDSALNFLLYLVDVNELINVALGTYDLETTIMVAQKSQKDPKEFLPFYNDLQKLDEDYRKYKIDMHLQRYKQALLHISKCEDHFDECILLIKNQRLYVDALYLFPASSDRYKIVWKEYGNYLMEKRYFDEAGLVFSRCGDHEKALLAYKECLNWQSMLRSAVHLSYSDDQVIALCLDLSEKLKSNQKHVDASFLLEHYVKDTEESIVTLIEGHEWNMALLMMSKYRRQDIAETHLKPALNEYHLHLSTYLDQLSKEFCEHTERLKFLRTQKKQESELPTARMHNEDELFSETGSVTDAASSCADSKQISGSIMTRKSSKSRRKQKLKKYRLKEGSPDEDLAHIVALSEIVTKIDNLKDNFLSTVKTLFQFSYDEFAKLLQQKMCSLVKTVESEIPIIWCPAENFKPSPELRFGPDSTANSIAASLQFQQRNAISKQTDPELSAPPWRSVDLELQMFR